MSNIVERVARAVRRGQFERTGRMRALDETVEPTDREMADALAALDASGHHELVAALREITERYVDLVNSGDCGFWEPEDEKPVKAARVALAKAGRQPDKS